ncbi:hypothetical protein ABJ851_002086 [Shigella flexneri]|nr:hypothetical protein [Escherichia coli]
MFILESQSIGCRISTTYLSLKYTESDGVSIIVDAMELTPHSKDYFQVELIFNIVAELKCVTLNFYEANYKNISINNIDDVSLDSGIYEVTNSVLLKEKEKLYDPKNRFILKHYIITGYDSYIEILAAGFSCVRCGN